MGPREPLGYLEQDGVHWILTGSKGKFPLKGKLMDSIEGLIETSQINRSIFQL